jgi:hypothetical protein
VLWSSYALNAQDVVGLGGTGGVGPDGSAVICKRGRRQRARHARRSRSRIAHDAVDNVGSDLCDPYDGPFAASPMTQKGALVSAVRVFEDRSAWGILGLDRHAASTGSLAVRSARGHMGGGRSGASLADQDVKIGLRKPTGGARV